MRRAVGLVAAALAVVTVLVTGLVLLRGAGGGDDRPPDELAAGPSSEVLDDGAIGPVVEVAARSTSERSFTSVPLVEELASPQVLRVKVTGFEEFASAAVRQCRIEDAQARCGNGLPVQFGPNGVATFQYLVTEDFVPNHLFSGGGLCRAGDPVCLVMVTSLDGTQRAELQTVFGDRLPPPGVATVAPVGARSHGQVVTVRVEGLPGGAVVRVTTCAAPSTSDPRRCGDPAPTASIVVGRDGTGQADLQITRGPVGSQRVRCGDDQACAVAVLSEMAGVRIPAVPITFAALPGAAYDPVRLTSGLAVAAALLLAAWWLVRRTDWSAVGEAAAPEIDEVEYADLDAIIAALPPLADEATAGA
ncbi:MAG TPA: hypothetical protein VGA36_07795 [Nitriliruptorales bacterium]